MERWGPCGRKGKVWIRAQLELLQGLTIWQYPYQASFFSLKQQGTAETFPCTFSVSPSHWYSGRPEWLAIPRAHGWPALRCSRCQQATAPSRRCTPPVSQSTPWLKQLLGTATPKRQVHLARPRGGSLSHFKQPGALASEPCKPGMAYSGHPDLAAGSSQVRVQLGALHPRRVLR